jgi:hypothetical protein
VGLGTPVERSPRSGIRYLADLLAHAGVERNALDLVDLVEGVATEDTGPQARRRRRAPRRRRAKTGVFYAYEPHPDDEIRWSVHSESNRS